MIPTAAATDEKPQQQQQQQQQQQPASEIPPAGVDDYYSDWTDNEIPPNDESEHTRGNMIAGHSMMDDVNTIDRQVTLNTHDDLS